VGRTIAGLSLRFGPEPDGSRAPFQDPTLPAGFHQLADERRWAESTPDSRRQLAEHLLPFTGVTAGDLEGQWADALELRARYRGLAHRAFWTTALDDMPDKLFRVLSTVHNIRGTTSEAERVFAGMTEETRGRKAPQTSGRAGRIMFIRHHARAHPDLARLAEEAVTVLKRNLLQSGGRGQRQWKPKIVVYRPQRASARHNSALDDVEADMSDSYHEDSDTDRPLPDLPVDLDEALLAGGRFALSTVNNVLGGDRTRQPPGVLEDDTPSEADVRLAVDDLLNPPTDSDSTVTTGATSPSADSFATTSSLIQRLKERHRLPQPPPPPRSSPT
ncbi:MAG: hypothetical protein GY856_25085, partial [bacterium]|nr:hypothetical protein [bacterium]